MVETNKKQIKVLVIGTYHQFQRHQDTMPDREKVRGDFDKFLRGVIDERTIDLVAEEAGDDTVMWENLKRNDELVGQFAEAFGGSGSKTVDNPVPTIASTIHKSASDNGCWLVGCGGGAGSWRRVAHGPITAAWRMRW